MSAMRLVCLGYGQCARRHAQEHRDRFERVTGTSRTPEKISANDVTLLAFDGVTASPTLRDEVERATHLLISAAPNADGDPVLAALADSIAAAPLQSIVYLSTIGVYGDHAGAWIDESAETRATLPRGLRRLDAERGWQALGRARDVPVAILRLGGIYGPDDNAIARVRSGRAHRIDKPGHVSNRIHIDDIAQAIDAAFTRRIDGVVNVVDGAPGSPAELVALAAELIGVAPPPLMAYDNAKRTLSPMLMSFYESTVRVRNDRLTRELGVTLRHPIAEDALRAMAAQSVSR